MKTRLFTFIAMVLALAAAAMAGAADNPFAGTWKLNVAKCKGPASQIPQSEIWKIEAQENGHKDSFAGIGPDGKPYHQHSSPKYDGKDYPSIGTPDFDTVALKKTDATTLEYIIKKAGKAVGSGQATVSKDGKILTLRGKGKDAKGLEFTIVEVYDRQLQ